MIRARLAEMRLALMLLTRLPAGTLASPLPSMAATAWAFPLAGLAVGGLSAATLWAALAAGLPGTVAAGLALGLQIAATGALHEDGLADFADGIWGGRDPERRLEIMRDSRIGTYGTVALILALGLRWQALGEVAERGAGPAAATIVALAMLSRVAPVALLAVLPPARSDGLGRSAAGVGHAGLFAALVIAGLPSAVIGFAVLPVLAVQALVTAVVGRLAQRRLGGQTGDTLGAAQQIAEIAGWIMVIGHVGASA